MKIAIISSSLRKKSHSLVLSTYASAYLENTHQFNTDLINMQDYPLPLCCPDDAYSDANVIKLKSMIESADSVIFSTPIYNYEVNSVLKNLLDLTGEAWHDKLVGMMCSAGGSRSYMAVMSFANSLMLNFRCLIVPRFVYATKNDFNSAGKEISNDKIKMRIEEICDRMVKLTRALAVDNT